MRKSDRRSLSNLIFVELSQDLQFVHLKYRDNNSNKIKNENGTSRVMRLTRRKCSIQKQPRRYVRYMKTCHIKYASILRLLFIVEQQSKSNKRNVKCMWYIHTHAYTSFCRLTVRKWMPALAVQLWSKRLSLTLCMQIAFRKKICSTLASCSTVTSPIRAKAYRFSCFKTIVWRCSHLLIGLRNLDSPPSHPIGRCLFFTFPSFPMHENASYQFLHFVRI